MNYLKKVYLCFVLGSTTIEQDRMLGFCTTTSSDDVLIHKMKILHTVVIDTG